MMQHLCKIAQERFEVILVDAPFLNGYKDATLLSNFADGVMLVISEGNTRRHVIKAAIAPLEDHKANIIGIILNNRSFPIPRVIYDRV